MKNLGERKEVREEKKDGEQGEQGEKREQKRKREKSNRDKKIYALTKSESMTSTTLYSHDTASQCVHPVLPTLLGTVYAHVHVLITMHQVATGTCS